MTDDARRCACGAPSTHAHVGGDPCCCWCHVVEHARAPSEAHVECMIAAKRIAAIQTRFRSAISAEREACVRLLESLKQPLEIMPAVLRKAARKNPEHVMQAILEVVVTNAAAMMRARIT